MKSTFCINLYVKVTTKAPVIRIPCTTGMVQCDHGKKCVYTAWKCDRIVDCSDGSDEKDCQDKTIVMSFEDLLHRHKQETRNKRSVELSNRPRLSNVNGNNETEDSEH
ncbi:Hypothetical predicted protein [Mytilus galloprovincialis]|uniref:Uncharacterized protein n=1 Tax=Mytilus galloprovincialis TaxID=29158 RepID=A0A8B6HFA2_MYTGA|nr:Hypothetical predicted protein [Mytilus galloprovincialis]